MSFRFRGGALKFGRTGVRLSMWAVGPALREMAFFRQDGRRSHEQVFLVIAFGYARIARRRSGVAITAQPNFRKGI
jgi:hypothetical protein